MVHLESATQRDQGVDQEVRRRMEEAAEVSDTLGDLRNNVRSRINVIPDMVHGKQVVDITAEQRRQVQETMQIRAEEIDDATKGYEHVGVTDELPDGVLGQTQLENPDAAVVRTGLVHAPKELRRTAMHESDEDVGHASQVRPDIPNEEVALVVDGEEFDATAVIEGDVERGVAAEMDGGTDIHRGDQPEETYAEGQRMANDVASRVGEQVWKGALKESGNYGTIQKELWMQQLQSSPDPATFTRVIQEAEKTGYYDEAREVLQPYMAQMMARARQETMATPMPA